MLTMRRPTLLRGWKNWYVDGCLSAAFSRAVEVKMIRNQQPACENRLLYGCGVTSGFVLAAFFIGKLFDFGIRGADNIIADCRFVGF